MLSISADGDDERTLGGRKDLSSAQSSTPVRSHKAGADRMRERDTRRDVNALYDHRLVTTPGSVIFSEC